MRRLTVGTLSESTAMRINKRDQRCVVVNVDPETAETDPSTLRAISRTRESCLGVYGSTVVPGRVSAGDKVYLVS